jgi:hypothetical protein
MSRPALAALIEPLATPQAAQAQRRNHRRRGGDRQSGARGGIFCEKITGAERVLAVILGLRKICTREIAAELLEVSRRTIGNASAWARRYWTRNNAPSAVPRPATRARRRYLPLPQNTKGTGQARNTTLNLYGFSGCGSAARPPPAGPRRSR